eukprot:3763189-Pyramimonas_sp.AAC.1
MGGFGGGWGVDGERGTCTWFSPLHTPASCRATSASSGPAGLTRAPPSTTPCASDVPRSSPPR